MGTVINPQTGKIQASFAPVAKHYGVTVVPCPPRRGNRKGVVEKQIHYLTQRWWRTVAAANLAEAQVSLRPGSTGCFIAVSCSHRVDYR
jgi:transposase